MDPRQYLTVFAFAATYLSVQAQLMGQLARDFGLANISARCRQISNATQADLATISTSQQVPTTAGGQCLLACVAQEFGMMRDNALSPESAQSLVGTLFPSRNDSMFFHSVRNAVNSCDLLSLSSQSPALMPSVFSGFLRSVSDRSAQFADVVAPAARSQQSQPPASASAPAPFPMTNLFGGFSRLASMPMFGASQQPAQQQSPPTQTPSG